MHVLVRTRLQRWLLLLWIGALLCPLPVWSQGVQRHHMSLLNPLEHGPTCTTATLSAAIAAAPATLGVLMLTPVDRAGVACSWAITSNLTIPSTLVLAVPNGASVTVSSGVTLTLVRYPRVDNDDWITGAGTVSITEPAPSGGGTLTIRTEDGTTIVPNVTVVRVEGAALVDQGGGQVSITTATSAGHVIQDEGVNVGSTPSTFESVINFIGAGIECVRNTGVAIECTIPGVSAPDATDTGTKGVSTYTATDFNVTTGTVSLDYTNGQAASASVKGYLAAADYVTFSAKVGPALTLTVAGTTNELTCSGGAQDLSANRTWTCGLATVLNLSAKTLLGGSPLVFEGSTDNTFETTVVVTDPTADRTFTIPNADSVAAQPDAGSANQFLTGMTSLGVFTRVQPNFGNLSGTCALAQGCVGLTTAPDDNLAIGNGTAWQLNAIPDCDAPGVEALTYNASTNALGCNIVTGLIIQNEASALTARAALNFTGAGVDCVDNPGSARTDCSITATGGGAGTPNYGTNFTSQTTVVVLGTTHGLGTRDLIPIIYDTAGTVITPTSFNVHPTAFDVTVQLGTVMSGRLVLNATSATAGGAGDMGSTGSTGFVVETGAGATVARTHTGTANLIDITNGSGISGNPTYTVGASVARLDTVQTFTGFKTFGAGASLSTFPLTTSYVNEAATGTTTGLLARLTSVSPATITRAAISDIGVMGLCISGCGTTGTAQIATRGQTACTFENATVAGNLAIVGTAVAGNCRDAGTTLVSAIPSTTQVLGRALETGVAGSRQMQLFGPGHYGTQGFSTSAGLAALLSDETGTGAVCFATAPTFVTPNIGVATATSINKLAVTAPTTSATLTIADGKTFTASNTIQLLATDGTVATLSGTGTYPSATSTVTLTNKRLTPRVVSLTDAATVTLNADTTDRGILLTLSQATTFANPTGTGTDWQVIGVRIKSTTARALTWGTQFRGSTSAALPTTTSGGGLTDYFSFVRNSADNKWDFMPLGTGY